MDWYQVFQRKWKWGFRYCIIYTYNIFRWHFLCAEKKAHMERCFRIVILTCNLGGWLHGEFQPCWSGKKTRLHGKFQPGLKLNVRAGTVVLLYLLLYTRVLRMRLRIFSPGWKILAITWRISARSSGSKISSRV